MGIERPVNDYLDGMLSREDLTLEERAEVDRLEKAIAQVATPLRSVRAPNLAGGVMGRISEMKAQPTLGERVENATRTALGWLWTPRPVVIAFRPALAMSVCAFLLVVSGLLALRAGTELPVQANVIEPETARPRIYVQFHVQAPGAARVMLTGTFTEWQPKYQLRETTNGMWVVTVPLEPGVHDYAYVVDDKDWLTDPHAMQIDDGLGSTNNRIALVAPMQGSQL